MPVCSSSVCRSTSEETGCAAKDAAVGTGVIKKSHVIFDFFLLADPLKLESDGFSTRDAAVFERETD